MKKILISFLILKIIVISAVNVTFKVDMRNQNVNSAGVFLAGTFNNWQTNADQLSDFNNDGIFEISKNLQAGSYQYKFLNGNTWQDWETMNQPRNLSVANSDIILNVVCYNDYCYIPANVNSTNNSATITWETDFPIDITLNNVVYSNLTNHSLTIENLSSCNNYQFLINYKDNPNCTSYNFATSTDLNLPADIPYIPIGTSQNIGEIHQGFCKIGWNHNTDFQWYQYDGSYYDITLGRSNISQSRSSVTSRGINLINGQTVYIKYRPSIYSNISNLSGYLKTSIGTSQDTYSQSVINSMAFSAIPPYTFPASQPQIIIPFTPPSTGIYYISLYSDDIPVFSNSQSVFLHNYDFQVTYTNLNTNDLENENYYIFPNPVINKFEFQSKEKVKKIELYNSEGKLLRVFYNSKNDVSFLKNGMYILKVQTEKRTITQKIIKE